MNATVTPEYRKLELDSSNEMMEHDGRRVLGRYPEAALHIREAGFGRARMGQIMFDAGEFAQAAADWLSAAACFYLATDPNRMRECLERVLHLYRDGRIPPERRDLHAALQEREAERRALEQKLSQFRQDYSRMVGPTRPASPEALSFLLRQVRDLPGSPHLHAEISGQAMQLEQRELAVESLDWARKFDPTSPHLATLRVSQLFAFGQSVEAAQLAREILAAYPEMGYLRILLAQALAFRAGDRVTDASASDWESALEVLRPLIESGSTDSLEMLTAISLAAILRHGLGHETEYQRLRSSFDKLAETVQLPGGREIVAKLRQVLPQIFPPPGSNGAGHPTANGHHLPAQPDYSAARRFFEQLNPLTAAAVA